MMSFVDAEDEPSAAAAALLQYQLTVTGLRQRSTASAPAGAGVSRTGVTRGGLIVARVGSATLFPPPQTLSWSGSCSAIAA